MAATSLPDLPILKELLLAARTLRRSPAFTFLAVAVLAFGIGANATVFSFVDSLLLEPLPYPESERLVQVFEHNRHEDQRSWVYYGNYHDWKERSRTFESLALFNIYATNLWGEGEPVRVKAGYATAEYFGVFGVHPLLGRFFTAEEEQLGRHRVAVLSHGLWQRRYGGDCDVVGTTLSRAGTPFEIIGVLPSAFRHPGQLGTEEPEVWFPVADYPERRTREGYTWEQVIGRLAPGASLDDARREMEAIARALEHEYPDTNTQRGVELIPLRDHVFGDLSSELRFLLLAVGLLLAVVCANLSGLVMVRSASRSRELAVRAALGAPRRALLRHLVLETGLLAILGAALGLVLAGWACSVLAASPALDLRRPEAVSLDATALLFTALVTVLAFLVFALVPASGVLRGDLPMHLKQGGRSAAGTRHGLAQRVLVSAEVALALMLVTGAGLLSRSYGELLSSDPGFRREHTLTIRMMHRGEKMRDRDVRIAFWDQLLERIRVRPEIRGAGQTVLLPLLGHDGTWVAYEAEDRQPPAGQEPTSHYNVISPGYLDAMGLTLLEGRDFEGSDRAGALDVVMVNHSFARRTWPGDSAVGKRLRLPSEEDPAWLTVVGVFGDVPFLSLDGAAVPEIYRPYAQEPWSDTALVLRSAPGVDPTALTQIVRSTIREIDPLQPIHGVRTMSEVYDRSLSRRRLLLAVLSGFALSALVLAAVGIYGTLAWSVARRRREIGLRMAVGARAADILRLVLAQSGRLFLLGLGIGLPLALALTRAMSGLLFGVAWFDAATFAAAGAFLALASFLASLVPALRAARVDPLVALRDE